MSAADTKLKSYFAWPKDDDDDDAKDQKLLRVLPYKKCKVQFLDPFFLLSLFVDVLSISTLCIT